MFSPLCARRFDKVIVIVEARTSGFSSAGLAKSGPARLESAVLGQASESHEA